MGQSPESIPEFAEKLFNPELTQQPGYVVVACFECQQIFYAGPVANQDQVVAYQYAEQQASFHTQCTGHSTIRSTPIICM